MKRAATARIVATLLVCLGTSACGPKVSLDVGVREEFGDLTYGDESEQAPPPPRPPAADPTGFPAFVAPPPSVRLGPLESGPPGPDPVVGPAPPAFAEVAVTPSECPGPEPAETPTLGASDSVVGAPAPGRYVYRRTGSVKQGARSVELPSVAVRTIQKVQESSRVGEAEPRRRFDVVEQDGDTQTTTTYEINPRSGIAIVAIMTEGPSGSSSFVPQPPVRIFNLPARFEAGPTDDQGVDPLSATLMQVSHRTVRKDFVSGCHDRYDAWEVKITGKIQGVDKLLNLDATLYIATQFGGIFLKDNINITGNDDGVAYELRTANEITTVTPRT